jgi:uncharacterized membrane protein YczE
LLPSRPQWAGERLIVGAGRLVLATAGLAIFACGVVLNLQANAGLSPWQVLHYGITLHTPLSFGQASQVVGVLMVAASWLAGVRPGLATIMNAVLVGWFTDLLLAGGLIPQMQTILTGAAMLVASLAISGLGIATYIRAGLGAGPRDSFMLALMRLLGRGPAPSRIVMEVGATLCGYLLGGPVGLGTALFAVGLGPAIGFWFRVLGVKPRAASAPARPARTIRLHQPIRQKAPRPADQR